MEKQIVNGCGGKKGTKCYVEEYTMPYMSTKKQAPRRRTDAVIGQKSTT